MMKSHEDGELVREISKLQAMVLELRSGFSRALLELNQIQMGDTELQSQLEETRHGCNKRSLHLETIILSLKEELEEIRRQIRQICEKQVKAEQKTNSTVPQSNSAASCSIKNESSTNGHGDQVATPLCTVGGALLLHCYLQGLWAGHNSGEALSQVSLRAEGPSASCSLSAQRQRVSVSLLKSEWDYVSKLNLLQEKYKTSSTTGHNMELHKVFVKHVDQMLQSHIVFRNCLQDKLSRDQPSAPLGEAFLQLTSQQNSSFCDGYLGYTAALATILTAEFSRDPLEKTQSKQEGEKEKFRLLSLLLAPVIRLHTYLNTVQLLLSCSGREHSDWCSLQETDQILRNLYTRCHMTLERAGRWTDGVGRQNEGLDPTNTLSGRCCEENPGCARSAFTKYRANRRTGTANCHATTIVTQQRDHCQFAAPQPLQPPAGILRNSGDRSFEPPSGWTENCTWDLPAAECHSLPRRPQHLFLNPGAAGAVGELSSSVPNLKSPSGLVERLCGSPGPDGRVCRSDVYSLPHHVDDGDTDADVGDTSVFDYSSVTTCSPDDTLELRGRDEEDDEEDSEIPVLLKPSYTHTHSGGAAQREGGVCARWQIPRAAPLPPEVCVGGSGTSRRTAKHRRKIPTSAFRPIWDAPFKQVDAAPAKETTVCFSNTNQIINPQPPTDPPRSLYRSVCSRDRDVIWNESEDSEGPCSNV